METFGWILSVLSVVGAVLNAKLHWSGFVFWLASNAGWVIYDLHAHNYPQAALFFIYFGISLYGLISWLRKGK